MGEGAAVKEAAIERGNEDYGSYIGRHADHAGLQILKFIGFEIDIVSAELSTGKFVVTENSCQPYNVLHGGTTAYIAESLASLSAGIASNFKRVAGIELNVNHLLSVPVGSEVEVTATPLRVGNRVQVWEVKFETTKPEKFTGAVSASDSKKVLSAVARVTLIVGLPLAPVLSKM